jgi:CHAD domain-containing protein
MSKDGTGTTIADVLGAYLTAQCEVALAIGAELETALGDDPGADQSRISADQIHDVRVAYRRLRSTIRIFGDVFSMPEAGRLSDDATWFALRLGGVRDLDVLAERLTAAIEGLDADLVLHDAAAELDNQIRYRRGIALAELRDALHSQAYADLVDQLRRWQQTPPWAPPASRPAGRLKKYVKHADRRLTKRLRRAADAIRAGDPEAEEMIHSARKAGKRHRYAVEAAASVIGSAAAKAVTAGKQLQDQLGEYQDSRLATDFLRDLGGIPGRNGFTFGVLYAQEVDHRRKLRKAIRKLAG